MERPVTRPLLATFIEYAATGRVTGVEWHRFAINHCGDEMMEAARREGVRVLHDAKPSGRYRLPQISGSDRDYLFSVAQLLRENQLKV